MGTHSNDSWTFLSNHAHVLVCLARDVTETRDIEARSKLIGQVVQAATEGVVILDPSRNVVSGTGNTTAWFGIANKFERKMRS